MKKERGTLVLIILLYFVWMVLGLMASALLMAFGFGSTPWGSQVLPFVPYVLLLVALKASSGTLLGKKPLELLSPVFRWSHFLLPGGAYLLGSILLALMEGGLSRSSFGLGEMLVSALLSLLLVPMATFGEEILFRSLPKELLEGYQGPKNLKACILIVASAILFTLPHLGNPEVVKTKDGLYAIVYYLLWGMLAMALGLWDGGFECTFAIHTANNLFVATLVNYDNSALVSRSLFLKNGDEPSYILIVNALVLYALAFLAVFALRNREKNEQTR